MAGLSESDRERRAIALAREEFRSVFAQEERRYWVARGILSGASFPGLEETDVAAVRTLLQKLEAVVLGPDWVHGHSDEGQRSRLLDPFRSYPAWNVRLWRTIGLSVATKTNRIPACTLTGLFLPSYKLTGAAIGLYICDTGWNLQPTLDLARYPVIFRTKTHSYFGAGSFVASYKARAGHEVLAVVGDGVGTVLDGWRASCAIEAFTSLAAVDDPERTASAALRTDGADSMVGLLDRYTRIRDSALADLARYGVPSGTTTASFWLVPCATGRGLAKPEKVQADHLGIRKGITFRKIRKSYIRITNNEHGKLAARSVANHHSDSTSVLRASYLNSSWIQRELDASIRQYQDALQSLGLRLLDQRVAAEALGITEAMLAEARQHAERAGIAGALGLAPDDAAADAVGVRAPNTRLALTTDTMREIALAYRGLIRARATTRNIARFNHVLLPLLVAVRAVGRVLQQQGMISIYRGVARAVARDVREGRLSLPYFGPGQ
ncbi:hypothetical protein D2T81_04015 [Azospirillum brasilense]|nr:hypothetical protein D2T81_04015 [Azospirillum brasilense]